MKKYGEFNKFKPQEENPEFLKEDLKFFLWKAELNKELMSFWKYMTK